MVRSAPPQSRRGPRQPAAATRAAHRPPARARPPEPDTRRLPLRPGCYVGDMSETEARQLLGVRLVLLLACSDGRDLEELRSFATREAGAIRDQLTAEGSVVRLSVRKAAAVVSGSETGLDRSDVDAAIDVTSEGDTPMDLIAAAKGLAERSDGVVDPRRSVAVAGREF